ncbi:DUF5682 family protein [Streptomyces zhihengii]
MLIEGPGGRRAGAPGGRRADAAPVALLAHAVDDPGRSAFWPFAAFSPEWVAVRWALAHGVPVRFIDLPAAHSSPWTRPAPARPPRPGTTAPPPGPGAAARSRTPVRGPRPGGR